MSQEISSDLCIKVLIQQSYHFTYDLREDCSCMELCLQHSTFPTLFFCWTEGCKKVLFSHNFSRQEIQTRGMLVSRGRPRFSSVSALFCYKMDDKLNHQTWQCYLFKLPSCSPVRLKIQPESALAVDVLAHTAIITCPLQGAHRWYLDRLISPINCPMNTWITPENIQMII